MEKLILSKISLADLRRLVTLQEIGIATYPWLQVEAITLTENELRQIQDIRARLLNSSPHLMNEATIWARGIYPLLALVEQTSIRAWAQVPLQAQYAQFEIEGIADGVLGKTVSGRLEVPYLVIVETKKGIEGQNPVFQLYGQLLAAARLNWEDQQKSPQETQEIFGCYTIADIWTFIRAEVSGIASDMPTLRVEASREYAEQYDAETIVKILKRMVIQFID